MILVCRWLNQQDLPVLQETAEGGRNPYALMVPEFWCLVSSPTMSCKRTGPPGPPFAYRECRVTIPMVLQGEAVSGLRFPYSNMILDTGITIGRGAFHLLPPFLFRAVRLNKVILT
jgi:hypothetical protein